MAKKSMYLSELFLETLSNDYSIQSLKTALKKCNKELLKRLSKKKLNCKDCLLCYRQELTDFFDVYNEFADELDFPDKNKLFILQLQYV